MEQTMQPAAPNALNQMGMNIAMAFGNAMAELLLYVLSVAAIGTAVATMVVLRAGLRWPAFGRSIVANIVTGGVATVAISFTIFVLLPGVPRGMITIDDHFYHFPYIALAFCLIAIVLQVQARASFSAARGVGILAAVLVPVAYFAGRALLTSVNLVYDVSPSDSKLALPPAAVVFVHDVRSTAKRCR
jgi:hypothetical protein